MNAVWKGNKECNYQTVLGDRKIWKILRNGYPNVSKEELGVETDDDAYTTKNTLIQLNYDKNDIIRNLKELKISEYIETLTDVKNVYSPQFWVFIKRINLKQVYIKVKIRSIQNRKIFCISFHFARFQVNNFPYG